MTKTQIEHIVFYVRREDQDETRKATRYDVINNVQFVFLRSTFVDYVHGPIPQWLYAHGRFPTREFQTTFPRHRRILLVTEPRAVMQHKVDYVNQFGVVLSSYKPDTGFEGIGIPSHIHPRLLHADSLGEKEKTRSISVICSQKNNRDHHRQRLRFVASLKEELGDTLDVFGHDSNPIKYKQTGILPYRYHVVLENCRHPHYWTEKIADAYMGEAYPFYSGCPNLHEYFPRDSYTPIDIFNIKESVDTVATLSASNLWREKRDAVLMAKKRLLHQHNRFATISHLVKRLAYTLPKKPDTPAERTTISEDM